jgi:hypothetical protein
MVFVIINKTDLYITSSDELENFSTHSGSLCTMSAWDKNCHANPFLSKHFSASNSLERVNVSKLTQAARETKKLPGCFEEKALLSLPRIERRFRG